MAKAEPGGNEAAEGPAGNRKKRKQPRKATDFVVSQHGQVIEHLADGPDDIKDDGSDRAE